MRKLISKSLCVSLAASALLLAACSKKPEPGAGSTAVDPAATGEDREQQLLAGAKQEGSLTIYTSAPVDDIGELIDSFKKKYGIKVEVWRSGSENVLQRVVTEARGNRYTADIVETNGPEMEAASREKIFQAVQSPYHKDLNPVALRPGGQWVATRLNVFVQAYNTNVVKKEDLPQQWDDLLKPFWKKKLGIEAEDYDWFAGFADSVGEEKGVQLFRDIVKQNGMSVRKGHTLLAQLVASGEVPMALTTYNYKIDQMREKGAPVAWVAIDKAIARPNGVGVTARAPHPHAAQLFYDYEISPEGQAILAKRNFVPVNKNVANPLQDVPLTVIDPAEMIDDYDKWQKLFNEVFGAGR